MKSFGNVVILCPWISGKTLNGMLFPGTSTLTKCLPIKIVTGKQSSTFTLKKETDLVVGSRFLDGVTVFTQDVTNKR